jgi:hypothetical protein
MTVGRMCVALHCYIAANYSLRAVPSSLSPRGGKSITLLEVLKKLREPWGYKTLSAEETLGRLRALSEVRVGYSISAAIGGTLCKEGSSSDGCPG